MIDTAWETPAELGIKPWEYEALVAVHIMFDYHLKTQYDTSYGHKNKTRKVGRLFNMNDACSSTSSRRNGKDFVCGTVACVGGWMFLYSKYKEAVFSPDFVLTDQDVADQVYEYVWRGRSETLDPLFFPDNEDGITDHLPLSKKQENWEHISIFDAYVAVNNFLTYGKPFWYKVLQ